MTENITQRLRRLVVALAAGSLVVTGCSLVDDDAREEDAQDVAPDISEPRSIVDAVAASGQFDTFVTAVEAADFDETLSNPGKSSITLFAPTDDAFAALPDGVLDALLLPKNEDVLTSILRYHVMSGGWELAVSWSGDSGELQTLLGEITPYGFDRGALTIGGADVADTTLHADDGEIRAIDEVLVPPSIDIAALFG